jgi:hypothetical protein
MHGVRSLFYGKKQKLSFFAGVLTLALGLSFVGGVGVQTASAQQDCDSNSIIYCGKTTPSTFISAVRANNSGNGHNDLQAVYNYYGLSTADYTRFINTAQMGTAYKDGRIVVGNKVVATAGKSIGRLQSVQGANPFSQPIAGTTYYGNTNANAFAHDSIPVMVMFDAQGSMEFAVLTSCGNPAFGTTVHTAASCQTLNRTPVAGKLNTYNFTAAINTSGNAVPSKFVYDFGDGTPTVTVTSNFGQVIQHEYKRGGTFTARVTEYASVPGNANLLLPVVTDCTKVITVTLPFYSCTSLTGAFLDKSKYQYTFVATANYGGGAVFTKGVFNFGDGSTTSVNAAANAKTVTTSHQFSPDKTYTVSTLLYFTVNGQTVSAAHACTIPVNPKSPTPPVQTCKPGTDIPVGDVRCNPCTSNPNYSADDTIHCVPVTPPVLPNTGAGNTIAIFAAVVVGAFLIYRQLLFRQHKAAFAAAQRGTSPLPLGDPLSEDAPLAGTPLEPAKRRSFRRKRQF